MRSRGARPRDDRTVETDRFSPIAGFEFKQSPPVIKDSEFDFERHVRETQSILDCHIFGRGVIRPDDQVTVFRKSRGISRTMPRECAMA